MGRLDLRRENRRILERKYQMTNAKRSPERLTAIVTCGSAIVKLLLEVLSLIHRIH
jgi:hypothetical protein